MECCGFSPERPTDCNVELGRLNWDGPTALSDRTRAGDSDRRAPVADLVTDRARAAPRRYPVPARRRHVLFSSGDLDRYQHCTHRPTVAVQSLMSFDPGGNRLAGARSLTAA